MSKVYRLAIVFAVALLVAGGSAFATAGDWQKLGHKSVAYSKEGPQTFSIDTNNAVSVSYLGTQPADAPLSRTETAVMSASLGVLLAAEVLVLANVHCLDFVLKLL